MSGPRIPVSLVTGFLGSGKTTLIARLLRRPGFESTLVIVNEFGEVGIDHDLLEASSDDTILLANGCLCCTIRGNLVDTLDDLGAQQAQGRLRAFDRVVVETSGIADPAPVLGFVFGVPRIAARFRPGRVVTTCDAVAGPVVLARHAEAVSQVAQADLLLLTKGDLAAPVAVDALMTRLRAINADAPIRRSIHGDGLDGDDLAPAAETHRDVPSRVAPPSADHTHRYRTLVLEARRPLMSHELDRLVASIRDHADPSLLRLKGLVALADGEGCGVIQAAPGIVHPPVVIAAPAPRPGQLVMIADAPLAPSLLDALAAFDVAPVPVLHTVS
ncbi:MAG: GTP-binding protein [Alphaproteobacteria bacterium]|nr:GTP-binding protein [Alphaproteobacteria bacterium]